MPAFSQPYVWKTNDVATAALMNANPSGITSALNNIDNGNIGSAGIFASQIKASNAAQATFGGTSGLTWTFPGSVAIPSGASYTYGLVFTTASGMGVYAGTGVPSFSAPNGSIALRYDGASIGANIYSNTSGPSTTGTTWTALSASGGPFILSTSGSFSNTSLSNGSVTTLVSPLTLNLGGSPNTKWRLEAVGSVGCAASNSFVTIGITGTTAASANAIASSVTGTGSFSGHFTNTLAESTPGIGEAASPTSNGQVVYGGDFNTAYGNVTLTLAAFVSGATPTVSGFLRILAYAI